MLSLSAIASPPSRHEPPWQAIREWIPADDEDPGFDLFDQRTESWKTVQIPREDGCILVLDLDRASLQPVAQDPLPKNAWQRGAEEHSQK